MPFPASQRLMFSSAPPSVEVESHAVPAPGPHQILVQQSHTQVSAGSESNFLRHGPASYGLPEAQSRANIGYMAAGRIVAHGDAVTGFRVGQRVITTSPHAAFSLVDVVPGAAIDPIPDGVSDDVAGFAILGDVALHGVRRAALQIDQSVAVFGLGVVGQLVLQLARISGAYPRIAIDLLDPRLEVARENGATHVIHAAREDVVARVREITGGAGAEAVFHCAQAAAILQTTMECAANRGSVILTGSPPGQATIRLKEELLRKELRVTGTYESGLIHPHVYWPWSRERNRRACLRLMAEGGLRLEPLITHRLAPAEAPAIYQRILAGAEGWLGVVFRW
ncbi:MAG: zinc-binding alcohol dehydrogenase [Verrucomicrobia bacterium]|nr:zinc-binding alcohol dehydrogenase [Verrucomicrobiota bacterium]